MITDLWAVYFLVFLAAILFLQATVIPFLSPAGRARRRLLERLERGREDTDGKPLASIRRDQYLSELSPLARWLETRRWTRGIVILVEQAGQSMTVARFVVISIALFFGVTFIGGILLSSLNVGLALGGVAAVLPYTWLLRSRAERTRKFDEQLPDALDVVRRALQAGHPFAQAINLVAEDMSDPVRREFELVFAEMNYGGDARRALNGLLERMPLTSVMAMITAVNVQKETGGNLAETMERIAAVLRSRFRLQRRIQTLSAEGRLSTWILALIPVGLMVALTWMVPDYLPELIHTSLGRKLTAIGLVLGFIGVLWVRRIVRIRI